MRSILVYADNGPGFADRMTAALDLARAESGHVRFVVINPSAAIFAVDPMGGNYIPQGALEALRSEADAVHARIAAQMAGEDVAWDCRQYEGSPFDMVAQAALLSDVIVLSLGSAARHIRPHPLLPIGDVAIATRRAILAVPSDQPPLPPAPRVMIAWDGGQEAANALRAGLSVLARAATVHLVTITEKPDGFPATDAAAYLSRHGIGSEIVEYARAPDLTIEEMLEREAAALDADLVVMGAYGHSRLRETLLGGVTRYALAEARRPLLLAH